MVDGTAAEFPVSCTARCPLFLDATRIGLHYQVFAALLGWMRLTELLQSIGLQVPWRERLRVEGTVQFTDEDRNVCVAPAKVLVLYYKVPGPNDNWDSSFASPHEPDAPPEDKEYPASSPQVPRSKDHGLLTLLQPLALPIGQTPEIARRGEQARTRPQYRAMGLSIR